MSEQDPIDDLPPDLRAMLDLVREPPPLPPEVSDRMLRALDVRVIAEAAAPSTVAGAKPTPGRGPFFRAPWQTLVGFLLGLVLGAAALALALVLGRRKVGFSKEEAQPHNVPLVLIGAAILWFGWFGFNGGAATSDGQVGLIFVNTLVAPAAALVGWIVVEHFKEGKATAVGAASGIVAGLVAITPACANLTPLWSIVLGLVAGAVCAVAIELKYKIGVDDTLDVVGIHLVAGFIGTLYLGFFAIDTGLFTGGNIEQLVVQVIPAVAIAAYSFVMAFILGTVIEKTIGFRAKEEDEIAGIDLALHGTGYALD